MGIIDDTDEILNKRSEVSPSVAIEISANKKTLATNEKDHGFT